MTQAAGQTSGHAAAACGACGAAPARPLFHKQGIPYYACPACAFVFSRPTRNANFENAIEDYEPAYLDYLEDSAEDARNHATLLRWAEGFGALTGEAVLDVGAGSGKFVRYLRGRGIAARGLEPAAPVYARFLARDPDFSPLSIEAYAAAPERPEFRAVFACDVLEHVAEPAPFLGSIRRLLAPGGVAFVSTPDVASAFARLCGRRWHYYNRYHLSYFSRETLGALAGRHGLREVGFARLPRSKSIGYLLQYAADFVWRGGGVRVPARVRRLAVPVNLYDTMYVAFERG